MFSEENKYHVDFKTEIKGYYIRGEEEYNTTGIISIQSKALKGHAEKLKEKLNYALKEANDAKLAQKEEKEQMINFKERMDKPPLKLSTPRRSNRLNLKLPIE